MTKKVLPENYMKVLRLIPKGLERPITGQEIAQLTRLSLRAVQDIISGLITRHHILICAKRESPQGYYFPIDDHERLIGIRALDKQRRNEETRLQILVNAELHNEREYLEG